MNVKKMTLLLVIGIIAMLVLNGCAYTSYTKNTYFAGDVTVEYKNYHEMSDSDYVKITFDAPGTYEIVFSDTKNKNTNGERIPEDFTAEIIQTPKEVVLSLAIIRSYLAITITRDGITEQHIFED